MHGSARDGFAQISVANPSAILARPLRPGQPPEDPLLPRRPEGEYAFLVNAGVSAATLVIAGAESRKFAATIHDILISAGHISPTAYASALADRLGVTLASWNAIFGRHKHDRLHDSPLEQGLPARIGDRAYHVLCAENGSPDELRRQVAALQARGLDVALASRMRIHEAIEVLTGSERLDHAVNSLARQQAAFSAAGPIWIWQVIAAAIVVGLVVGGFSILPDATIAALSAVMALPFLCVTVLRMIALREVIASRQQHTGQPAPHIAPLPPQTLPVYSILVPLFREVQALPGLVQSLQALDYPRAKVEILLVLEAVDMEMQAAVLATQLPGNFRTIIVPDQAPRTKPKALNYAPQAARGEYLVVYDAEDRPEPDQLLRALEAFRHGPPHLGCVQAQLNIHNPNASWLTRGLMAQTPQELNPL